MHNDSHFSEAMFTYSRSRNEDHTLSSFMDDSTTKEVDDDSDQDDNDDLLEDSTSNFKMPQLDDVSAGNALYCKFESSYHISGPFPLTLNTCLQVYVCGLVCLLR